MDIDEAERFGRDIQLLRWFDQAFPEDSPWAPEEVANSESIVAKRILKLIKQEVGEPTIGLCISCGEKLEPWFDQCYSCKFGHRDYYDYDPNYQFSN